MGLTIQHPVTWTVATESGKEVFRDSTDAETTITLYKGTTWKEEMDARTAGDEPVKSREEVIAGGFETILTYQNEGATRYRDLLFRRIHDDHAEVIVAEMITTVPNDAKGLPDFTQSTVAEEILATARLLSPNKQ